MRLLMTEWEASQECECGDHEDLVNAEELAQVDRYLRVAKDLWWRQEELESIEAQKRGPPVVQCQNFRECSNNYSWSHF